MSSPLSPHPSPSSLGAIIEITVVDLNIFGRRDSLLLFLIPFSWEMICHI
jgi:hypothetical protein